MFAFIFLPLDSEFALYAVLFLVLILSGIGLPIPEEATLLFGGYLAYLEFVDFWVIIYVSILGIIAADVMGYFLGRFFGEKIIKFFLGRWKRPNKVLEKAQKYFDRHGEKVVIFSRPLLGIRIAVPILAGHFKMNFIKFLVYDLLAAIPWAFLLISLSYFLGSGLDLITEVKEVKHTIFVLLGIAIAVFAAIKFNKSPHLPNGH